MLKHKNTYLFFGGTLEAFINFRLHFIYYIAQRDETASIICVHFGNIEKRSIPKNFKDNVEWALLNWPKI